MCSCTDKTCIGDCPCRCSHTGCDLCNLHIAARRRQILPLIGRWVCRTGQPPRELRRRYRLALHVGEGHAGGRAA